MLMDCGEGQLTPILGCRVSVSSIKERNISMKAMSLQEVAGVSGGGDPITLGTALYVIGMAVSAYLAKDFYEHWEEVKAGFADGWNHA
jgi:hypothetical protein